MTLKLRSKQQEHTRRVSPPLSRSKTVHEAFAAHRCAARVAERGVILYPYFAISEDEAQSCCELKGEIVGADCTVLSNKQSRKGCAPCLGIMPPSRIKYRGATCNLRVI